MISTEHVRTFARYNRWMNAKLYDCAARLTDPQRKEDVGAFFKSIHGTLNHLLLGDAIWMGRLEGPVFVPNSGSLAEELHPDFGELRHAREAMDIRVAEWAARLTDAALGGELRYTSIVNPAPRSMPMWLAVTHFFNHQTHHRGQVTALLMQRGIDPGVTDLMWTPKELAVPGDVVRYVERCFAAIDRGEALATLREAVLPDVPESPGRLLRCAVISANRDVGRLRKQLAHLAVDYRDVIVEGEYVVREGKLVRVRDLNGPIGEGA